MTMSAERVIVIIIVIIVIAIMVLGCCIVSVAGAGVTDDEVGAAPVPDGSCGGVVSEGPLLAVLSTCNTLVEVQGKGMSEDEAI